MDDGVKSGIRHGRVEVKDVVYVSWRAESAFILNLSEGGLAVQAMDVLRPGESLAFAFALPADGAELAGVVRVVWSDRSGRAGLQFVDLPEFDRFQLRKWLSRYQN